MVRRTVVCLLAGGSLFAPQAFAHDPVFGLGPHTLFKGGVEVHTGYHREEAGSDTDNEATLAFKYGLTGDWVIGADLPYKRIREADQSSSGVGDLTLTSKYRFWRRDSLALQESAAVLLGVDLSNGDETKEPALGNGATDWFAGLTYGYEGRKWYRWAAIRHRFNGENDQSLRAGDKTLVDLVVGLRLTPTPYTEPDTVWMLELNGEHSQRAELNGASLANSGGTEWFVSPGLMWTQRNFAVKTGVQVPLGSDLNGRQDDSDYRFKLELEWHL